MMFRPFAFISKVASAVTNFILSAGGDFSGATDPTNGKAYQWGIGTSGQKGDNQASIPATDTLPKPFSSTLILSKYDCGFDHVVSIEQSAGRAYAWGSNSSGQLGDNTNTNKSSPVSVAGARSFSQIAAGTSYSLAIEGSTGRAYAWGSNSSGQLGDNLPTSSKNSPTSVAGGRSFSQIAAGNTYALAIEGSTGRAYAWGSNTSGQLGDNLTISEKSSPTSVAGARSFSKIAAGSGHSLAIEGATGRAYAWGENSNGQLGDNLTTSDKSSPVSVAGGRSFSQIAAGNTYSFAIEGSTGNAYAWGNNTNGRLGDNTVSVRSSPVSVVGGRSFSQIAGGTGHSLAYEPATGVIWAWGNNASGQLGNGSIAIPASPVSSLFTATISNLAAFSTSNLYIQSTTGNAYAWGTNTNGRLGDGSINTQSSPVSVLGGRSFSQIAAGTDHSLAIEGSTGRAYAWGINTNGCLGDNLTISDKSSPVSVAGGRSFSQISAGNTYSLAIEGSTGRAYAWGTNTNGRLGDNLTISSKSSPVSVAGGRSFSRISAGSGHSLAIEGSTGRAYAWGINTSGQLGDNLTISDKSSPVSVAGGRSFSQISAGAIHSLAIEGATGRAYAWGENSNGQLGDNLTTFDKSSPVSVAGGRSFSQISAGSGHSLAIEGSTGRAYVWGINTSGNFGDNTTGADKSSPVSVAGGRSFSQIKAAGTKSVAYEASTGVIWVWGTIVNQGTAYGDGVFASPVSVGRIFI